MKEYRVGEEDLFELLCQAYQEGYEGYKEMGESVARKLAKRFLKSKKEAKAELSKGDVLESSVILDGGGHQWHVGEGAQVTFVADSHSQPDGEIILPNTTLNSWDTLGIEE